MRLKVRHNLATVPKRSAKLLKIPGDDLEPYGSCKYTKYLPSHLKPNSHQSSFLTGHNLKAFFKSILAMYDPVPALTTMSTALSKVE